MSHNPAIGRFLSVDPLVKKNLHQSPYAYADNSPTAMLDIDGGDGILYIIALNNPGKAKLIVQHAQSIVDELGLNIQVKLFEHTSPEEFNKSYLDETDGFAVFGVNPTQVHRYITDKGIHETGDLYGYKFTYENPGKSRTRIVEVQAFNSIALDEVSGKLTLSKLSGEDNINRVLGFLAVHGYGHYLGEITHAEGKYDTGFMSPGKVIDSKNSIDALLEPSLNEVPAERINEKMRSTDNTPPQGPLSNQRDILEYLLNPGGVKYDRTPTDNYERNRRNNEK